MMFEFDLIKHDFIDKIQILKSLKVVHVHNRPYV